MKVKEKLLQFRNELTAKKNESRLQKVADEKDWKKMLGKCNSLRKREQTLLDREANLKEKVAKLKVEAKEAVVKAKVLQKEREEQLLKVNKEKVEEVEMECKRIKEQVV